MNEFDVAQYLEKNVSRRKLLLGLTSLAILPFAQEAKAFSGFDPFSFGYVTGSYLITGQSDNYKLLQESQLFLQDAIKGLNAEQLDFVLFGGDNVEAPGNDETNWQLFLDIAQSLNCPWNFVLGEQDISGALTSDPMKIYGRDWKGKGIDRDVPYWSNDPMTGIHVVGLYTARHNSSIGNLGKQQLDWLKEDLKTNRHKFTIVASHHPLLPPAPFDGGSPWDDYVVPQGASAREIMGQFPSVRLALSGHVHINKIQQERSIWYVSSPSLAVYPCAYRIFRVTTDYVSVETYQVAFPQLIKKAKQKVETWSLPYKYSPKVEAFTELMDGGKSNQFAGLPMAAGKSMEPMSAKKRKESEKSAKGHKGEKAEKDEKHDKTDKIEKNTKIDKAVKTDKTESEDKTEKVEATGTTSDASAANTTAEEHKGMFGFGKKKKNNKGEKTDKPGAVEKIDSGKSNDATVDLKNKSDTDTKTQDDKNQSSEYTKSDRPTADEAGADKPASEMSKPIPELLSAPDPRQQQQDKKSK